MGKKNKLATINLEHLTFAPGEEIFFNQYAYMGECVDLFEELPDDEEGNEMINN